VFCEVKTRRGARYGGGFEAVDARKRQKLRALAEVFLQQHHASPSTVRFDVASVRLRPDGSASVEVFHDAF
jgi:putative endonuclease